jgi:hypothetical protein
VTYTHPEGLPLTRDRPVAETSTWQHQNSKETAIHTPGRTPWKRDRLVAETSTWQHKNSQETAIHTCGRAPWTRDQPVAETPTWHHTKFTRDSHAPLGIRTRNPNKRTAEDLLLRPHGHRERLINVNDDKCDMTLGMSSLGVLTMTVTCNVFSVRHTHNGVKAIKSRQTCKWNPSLPASYVSGVHITLLEISTAPPIDGDIDCISHTSVTQASFICCDKNMKYPWNYDLTVVSWTSQLCEGTNTITEDAATVSQSV